MTAEQTGDSYTVGEQQVVTSKQEKVLYPVDVILCHIRSYRI